MNIQFTDPRMIMCQQEYNKLDPEQRLSMSHFDLASNTPIDDTEPWIEFLKDPRVADKINEELSIYKEAQQRKLIQRATTHDKSVGTAQMINALGKSLETEQAKTGTIMIYSYVPMNAKEAQSPNASSNTTDIFERG
jgi:hypothetical protein